MTNEPFYAIYQIVISNICKEDTLLTMGPLDGHFYLVNKISEEKINNQGLNQSWQLSSVFIVSRIVRYDVVVSVVVHCVWVCVFSSGSSVLQLPAWGQGALCEQPRREIPHQTAAPSAPASRQWGESPNWSPSPNTFIHPSIHKSIPPFFPSFRAIER